MEEVRIGCAIVRATSGCLLARELGMLRVAGYVLLGLAVGVGLAVVYGSARWRRATDELEARLLAARMPLSPAAFDARQLEGLPVPVQRYLRTVVREGRPRVAIARFTHRGTFDMGEDEPSWQPFTSSQIVTTSPPGFIWDARIGVMPGVDAFVHDAYVGGEGILHGSALGLVTVADLRGTPEIAEGELYRYLAETPWYPTAMLPGHGITWTAVDDGSAQATLTHGSTTSTMLFRFGADGLVESAFAAARGRTMGERVVPMPWGGRYWSYAERDGIRVPLEAEVSWLPAGQPPQPYWRGTITSIAFSDN